MNIEYYTDIAHNNDPRIYHAQCMSVIKYHDKIRRKIANNISFYRWWSIYHHPDQLFEI